MQQNPTESFNFRAKLEKLLQQLTVEERTIVLECFKNCGVNDRQKIKTMKKIVESNEDKPAKNIVKDKMGELLVGQYIFGSLEAKPMMMNLLKYINIDKKALEQVLMVENFEKVKRSVEVFQIKLVQDKKQELGNILRFLFGKLMNELQIGSESIAKNEFRTKWLDTFVEVIRCMNSVVRLIGRPELEHENHHVSVLKNIDICLQHSKVLSKEVLTQLYLCKVFMDPHTQAPESTLLKMHYLHSLTIVQKKNTLISLLHLITELKQTEHKSQLAPILLKSFQENFLRLTEEEKHNCFDIAILLFEVGRSVYSYLEEILQIIIKNGGSWNFQGSFTRKFFIGKLALKYNSTSEIIGMWPTIVEQVIVQCGNMTVPYVSDCAEVLFGKLYAQSDNNYEKWVQGWIGDYKKALASEDRGCIRGIVDFINPILLKINPKPYLLIELYKENMKDYSIQIGIISLLKCYKQIGKVVVDSKQRKFHHVEDEAGFPAQYIMDLLLSNDYMIATKALEFLTLSHHPSEPLPPLQLELIFVFYEDCLKTSLPEYRKNYLTITKKLLERLRMIYNRQLTGKKRIKPVLYFEQFKTFINKLVNLCFRQLYPDVIFQLANPALEILMLVFMFFGNQEAEVRKGTIIEPIKLLLETSFFQSCNFYNLVSCLQSSYESIRSLAHSLLKAYTSLPEEDEKILQKIWLQSLQNTNKLAIKSYEFACRMLSFISTEYPQLIPHLPDGYKIPQLNICELFLNLLKERYSIFKQQFIDQSDTYYKNLLHGILTVFSYLLEELAIRSKQQQHFKNVYLPHANELRQFLIKFFNQMIEILNFSVEISSANVSTVVLDTLIQSQTDKKLKVDCRGHFLTEQKPNMSEYIESTATALISSMDNEEEGIQNTLVVSFYLLTREAGLVFQTIGSLVDSPNSKHYMPNDHLIQLVTTYFYALINLKHMGSVDRISNGLGKMSKIIFQNQNKQLSQLPEKLLNKLLQNLESGKFTNILRRSAGVPYAFSCLLKSEALKRKHLIEKTIKTLFSLSTDSQSIELKIHSLNILKKLFQDSDLKQDLDVFVSQSFIISIRGFTSDEWGVRNSSLMLFSVLANRTLGIKPTYNLLQFFHKCPTLLPFIWKQLTTQETTTMYPPLYPIVLLLSRLLPFDLKEKPRMTLKGLNKQVRKEELLQLLPIIEKSGINHNYMGRVMAAKAILPFMQVNQIINHVLETLTCLSEWKTIKSNELHYRLVKCYQLLLSLHQICEQQKYHYEVPAQTIAHLWKFLSTTHSLLHSMNCPTIKDVLAKIFIEFIRHYEKEVGGKYEWEGLCEGIGQTCHQVLSKLLESEWWIKGDLGESLMVKSCIDLYYHSQVEFRKEPDLSFLLKAIDNLHLHIMNNPNFFTRADNQLICAVLSKIALTIKQNKSTEELSEKLKQFLADIKMETITNDDVFIHVLNFAREMPQVQIPLVLLQQTEEKTQNKHMKVSIFRYMHRKEVDVRELMKKYSSPEELEEIRYLCVEALERADHFDEELLLVYTRLLEDEEYQIRREAAKELSRLLGIPQYNEAVVLKRVLKMMKGEHLVSLMKQNSDYEIRKKNDEEERIFSYDKPNKYRTDINHLVEVALHLGPEKIHQVLQNEPVPEQGPLLDAYATHILERNQYQFESVIRMMLKELPSERFKPVVQHHPIFKEIYHHMG